jgi:hypothetical protein
LLRACIAVALVLLSASIDMFRSVTHTAIRVREHSPHRAPHADTMSTRTRTQRAPLCCISKQRLDFSHALHRASHRALCVYVFRNYIGS